MGMRLQRQSTVFPTYVGVNRGASLLRNLSARVPHVCGGEPRYVRLKMTPTTCSPRMWG